MDELYNEVCDIIQEQYNIGELTEENATTLMEAAYDRYVVEGTNRRVKAIYDNINDKLRNKKYYDRNRLTKLALASSMKTKKDQGKLATRYISHAIGRGFNTEDLVNNAKASGLENKKFIDHAISKLSPSKEEAMKNKKEFIKTLPRSSKPTNKRVLHTRDSSTIRKMNNTLPYKKNEKKSFTFNKPFGKMKSSKKINIK